MLLTRRTPAVELPALFGDALGDKRSESLIGISLLCGLLVYRSIRYIEANALPLGCRTTEIPMQKGESQ
jgi:hypothetical protein